MLRFKYEDGASLPMAEKVVTRTYRASICNHSQVEDDLTALGVAASRLWNIGRWTAGRVWEGCGLIPGHQDLTASLNRHERYADLHSQSSQRVLQELAEAFRGWVETRKRTEGGARERPPGYRKRGDDHPRSTVTFKLQGFWLDPQRGRVRLSKGRNLKAHHSDFLLCEYQTRPDVDLGSVDSVQQVRAVWTGSEWELQFVCKLRVDIPEPPGDGTMGIDLGICTFAALATGDGHSELYPMGCLKEDDYYFGKRLARCDDAGSRRATRLHRTWSNRRQHYLHALSTHVVKRCVELEVGQIAIGDLRGIREDEEGEARNWGSKGNLKLHRWPFDRFSRLLTYKAEMAGISIDQVDERGTSKTCSCCGRERRSNRVERGLYSCDRCGLVANADVNGAENIRQVPPSPGSRDRHPDRSNGWLAQPTVFHFDRTDGMFRQVEGGAS